MKTMMIILTLVMGSHCYSQTMETKKFDDYEHAKLEKAVALSYWLFVPGGGSFYANASGYSGPLFLAGDISLALWVRNDIKKGQSLFASVFILTGFRIVELATAFAEVDNYNDNLRVQLNLTERMDQYVPTLVFSYRF